MKITKGCKQPKTLCNTLEGGKEEVARAQHVNASLWFKYMVLQTKKTKTGLLALIKRAMDELRHTDTQIIAGGALACAEYAFCKHEWSWPSGWCIGLRS